MSRDEATLTRINWKGRTMTPVVYTADNLITLLPPRYALKLKNEGAVGILSEEEWNRVIGTHEPNTYNLDGQYAGG